MNKGMGDFEMGVLATQIRAGLARLSEFTIWPEKDRQAIERVDGLMAGLLEDLQTELPKDVEGRIDSTPCADDEAATAERVGSRLLALHPARRDAIARLMWMSVEGGVHYLKHRHSRRMITFDEASGVIRGRLDTGEESDDGDAVLRHADAD